MVFATFAYYLVILSSVLAGNLYLIKHPDIHKLFNPVRHQGGHYLSQSTEFKFILCKNTIKYPSFTSEDEEPMTFNASKMAERRMYQSIYRYYRSATLGSPAYSLSSTIVGENKLQVVVCSGPGKEGMLFITDRNDSSDLKYFVMTRKETIVTDFDLNGVPQERDDGAHTRLVEEIDAIALVEESGNLTEIQGTSIENEYLTVEDMLMNSLKTPTDFNFCDTDDLTKHRICCSTYTIWNPHVSLSKWNMRTFTVEKIMCLEKASVTFSRIPDQQETTVNHVLKCSMKLLDSGFIQTVYVTADSSSIENAYILLSSEKKDLFQVIRHMNKLNAYKEYRAGKENWENQENQENQKNQKSQENQENLEKRGNQKNEENEENEDNQEYQLNRENKEIQENKSQDGQYSKVLKTKRCQEASPYQPEMKHKKSPNNTPSLD